MNGIHGSSIDKSVFNEELKECSTILVVDDDRTLRMILVKMLEDLGYAILEAQDGKQAIDTMFERNKTIDALILDREMPIMNGMKLLKFMKNNEILMDIPVIMQTGNDSPEQINEGVEAGVFDYIIKPVKPEVLKSVLTAALSFRKSKKVAT